MRSIVRHFIYILLAMHLLQTYAEPFELGGNELKTFLIVAFAISIIVFLSKPILKIISFPVGGIIYTLLLVLVIGAAFYALESLLPNFAITSFTLSEIGLFGIMQGGLTLEGFQSLAFVSGFTAVTYSVLAWIMG